MPTLILFFFRHRFADKVCNQENVGYFCRRYPCIGRSNGQYHTEGRRSGFQRWRPRAQNFVSTDSETRLNAVLNSVREVMNSTPSLEMGARRCGVARWSYCASHESAPCTRPCRRVHCRAPHPAPPWSTGRLHLIERTLAIAGRCPRLRKGQAHSTWDWRRNRLLSLIVCVRRRIAVVAFLIAAKRRWSHHPRCSGIISRKFPWRSCSHTSSCDLTRTILTAVARWIAMRYICGQLKWSWCVYFVRAE